MPVSSEDLANARQAWGNGLIAISEAYELGGIDAARSVADQVLATAYGYGLGSVLFKPTLASGAQTFRPNRKGALSYFVGHDDEYPLDTGFGLMGWRKMESATSVEFIEGDIGMWMGEVVLTDKDGNITRVDKSFGYKKDDMGVMRIVLHHSSLPYQP